MSHTFFLAKNLCSNNCETNMKEASPGRSLYLIRLGIVANRLVPISAVKHFRFPCCAVTAVPPRQCAKIKSSGKDHAPRRAG